MAKILVIKHGALGDVVLATGAFAAIRKHHKDDNITILTTPVYAAMLRASPYFDEVWIDTRPKLYHFKSFFALIEKIRRGNFQRIYDLQTSERTSWYFKLLKRPIPEWVGIAKNSSHRHNTPERKSLHTVERQRQQLEIAGIKNIPLPDISWLTSVIGQFNLPENYALIVPGGSEHRPGKRWPAHYYGDVCIWLVENGIAPVIIGTRAEAPVISTIESICPEVLNLIGQTSFFELAELAREANFAIGNDTGPIHIISATGCKTLVLFSHFSNPKLCAPRGDNVTLIQEHSLVNLSIERIKKWVNNINFMKEKI
ncbi:MAG: glycosyltransferase family 9 protein [Pseudomonadota bacterium]